LDLVWHFLEEDEGRDRKHPRELMETVKLMEPVVFEREAVSPKEEGIVETIDGGYGAAHRKWRHDRSIERRHRTRVHEELTLREAVRDEPVLSAESMEERRRRSEHECTAATQRAHAVRSSRRRKSRDASQ
jgi:hypothetical protein